MYIGNIEDIDFYTKNIYAEKSFIHGRREAARAFTSH